MKKIKMVSIALAALVLSGCAAAENTSQSEPEKPQVLADPEASPRDTAEALREILCDGKSEWDSEENLYGDDGMIGTSQCLNEASGVPSGFAYNDVWFFAEPGGGATYASGMSGDLMMCPDGAAGYIPGDAPGAVIGPTWFANVSEDNVEPLLAAGGELVPCGYQG